MSLDYFVSDLPGRSGESIRTSYWPSILDDRNRKLPVRRAPSEESDYVDDQGCG
jgi:hypothetical protein